MRRMQTKHHAQCIRQGIVEYLDQLQIIAWDDRDDTDDQILSNDKFWAWMDILFNFCKCLYEKKCKIHLC